MVKASEYIQNILNVSKIFFFSYLFSTFIISGPSTSSVSVGLMIAGNFNPGGKEVTDGTQCLTDTFTITNQVTVPMICGINTGYHGKF
jgi:hypothetical protein